MAQTANAGGLFVVSFSYLLRPPLIGSLKKLNIVLTKKAPQSAPSLAATKVEYSAPSICLTCFGLLSH